MRIFSLYDHYLSFRVKDSISGDDIKIKIYYVEQSSGYVYWWDWTSQQWTTSPTTKESSMTYIESEMWKSPYVQMSSGWSYNNIYTAIIINYSDNQIFEYPFRINYYWLDDLLAATDSRLNNLDVAVSSRADGAYYTSTRAAKLDNLDTTISSRANATYYTQTRATKLDYLDAAITSRAPASTALSNTVWTDTKAGYLDTAVSSRVASNDNRLNNLDATISSRAPASTALSNNVWTDTKAGYLDASVSSRATLSDIESSTVLAKESTVSAVKIQTDKMQFTVNNDIKATLDGETVVLDSNQPNYAPAKAGDEMSLTSTAENNVSSKVWQHTNRKLTSAWTDEAEPRDMAAIGGGATPQEIWSYSNYGNKVDSIKSTVDSNLDATVSSRASSLYYTQARAEKLDNLDAAITSRPTLAQIESSTVLAKESTSVAIKSQTDKLSFNASNDIKATLDGETVVLDSNQPNYAPSKAGDEMSLTTDTKNDISSKIWQHQTRKLTSAWTDETEPRDMAAVGDSATPQEIWEYNSYGTKVDSVKSTIDSNLDTTVSSRAPAFTALSNTVWTDAKAGYLDASISSRLSGADERLDNLDAKISDRPTLLQIEGSSVLAKEVTVNDIKEQTDKLSFDSDNNIYATITNVGHGEIQVIVKNDTDSSPIANVYIYVKDNTDTILMGMGRTSSEGISKIKVPTGDYLIYAVKQDISFSNPYTVSVATSTVLNIVGHISSTPSASVAINENYGGANNLSVIDINGNYIEDVVVRIYAASDTNMEHPLGTTRTLKNGKWEDSIFVQPNNSYKVVFQKTGLVNATADIVT